MKRRIAGILFVLVTLTVASSLVFADTTGSRLQQNQDIASTEVNFTAKLHFNSAVDEQVKLELTNHGKGEMTLSSKAHYIDQIGSAGSWDCQAGEDVLIGPQQTKQIPFVMAKAAVHGDNSILAFYFQYQGKWYLGKVGENNGIEYFLEHT